MAAFGRFILNFINLEAFYSTTVRSLDSNTSQVEKEWRDGFKKVASDTAYAGIKKDNPLFGNEQLGEKFADAMGSRTVRLAKQTVGAASLVFAHTLLDEALTDACWISFVAKPEDWYPFVANRKVEIGQLRAQTLDETVKRVVSDSIEQIERDSMVKRLGRIHEICMPQLNGQTAATRWIQLDQLEKFDGLRHRIIHDARFTGLIKTLDDDIYFAKQAGLSVLMLLHQVYRFSPDDAAHGATEQDMLRFCAIIRREFPEIWELVKENADAFQSTKRGAEIRRIIAASKQPPV